MSGVRLVLPVLLLLFELDVLVFGCHQTRSDVQLDFFPEQVRIEPLDPKKTAGTQSKVDAIYVVRFEWEKGVHQVFRDQYGVYCADHGRLCRAVSAVTARYTQ